MSTMEYGQPKATDAERIARLEEKVLFQSRDLRLQGEALNLLQSQLTAIRDMLLSDGK